MPKRKYDDILTDERNWSAAARSSEKQHTLDSDEEDGEANEDTYNVMNEEDFEGAEDGPMAAEATVGFTAFNMKEELEEGHFDKDGHYLWNKEKEIRDNWLDNIDWVQIKPKAEGKTERSEDDKGLGGSDSEEESSIMFDPIPLYRQILEYLQPGETVSKALCRLGKGKKRISSAERWKRKKAGLSETDENSDKIMKLTELANELLTRTGNMDIYQEGYEGIKKKIDLAGKQAHPSKQEAELDMYADDFDSKEKAKLDETNPAAAGTSSKIDETESAQPVDAEVTWEFKWSQNENSETHGPNTTEQMHKWAKEGYFKSGAWVRRTGQAGQFYSVARVDFELYM